MGSPPVLGEQLRSCSAPLRLPPLQLQPVLPTKGDQLTSCGICCCGRLHCSFCLDLFPSEQPEPPCFLSIRRALRV